MQLKAIEEPTGSSSASSRGRPQAVHILAPAEILALEPSTVALSAEEAQWLLRHGFPSQNELSMVGSYDESALLTRSRDRGDSKATTLLGLQRMKHRDYRGGYRSLAFAADQGSLYALEQLAYSELAAGFGYRPGQVRPLSDDAKVIFVARMEVARMMGDHRVDYFIRQVAGDLDRNRYGDRILAQTTEFMRQMGAHAALTGARAADPDLRPNRDRWAQLEIAPATSPGVPVFRPGG